MKNTAALILIFCLIGGNLFAQKASRNKQIKLEEQRIKLREEIKQINSLLFENKNQKKSTLSEVEDIQLRISVRKQLIRVNNEQANFLDNNWNYFINSTLHRTNKNINFYHYAGRAGRKYIIEDIEAKFII